MDSSNPSSVSAVLLHAVQVEDWDKVSAVLEQSWQELFHRAPEALLTALDTMPGAVMDRQPRLRLAREYIARNVRGDEHSSEYRNATAPLVPVEVVDNLAMLTAQIAAARSDGRDDEVLRLVDAAHETLRKQPVEQGPGLAGALPELHYQWALALERAGQFERAVADYNDSFDWAVSVGHRMMQTAAAGAIAYLHALHGRIGAARKWLEKQPTEATQEWWTATITLQARMARALVAESALGQRPDLDPLADGEIHELGEHWAPFFFTRAMTVRDPRHARVLRKELDAFLSTLPLGQTRGTASVEYLAVTRLLLASAAQDSTPVGSTDRPTARASFLRQLAASIGALRAAREGRHRLALELAMPLLHIDGSRPRVIVLASLAAAIATESPARRAGYLEEGVLIALSQGCDSTFITLPDGLRADAASLFESHGATETAASLRMHVPTTAAATASVLSRREQAVIEHAVAGETTAQIAELLCVSPNTVKTQLRSAYRKLGVTSRRELIEAYHHPSPAVFARRGDDGVLIT